MCVVYVVRRVSKYRYFNMLLHTTNKQSNSFRFHLQPHSATIFNPQSHLNYSILVRFLPNIPKCTCFQREYSSNKEHVHVFQSSQDQKYQLLLSNLLYYSLQGKHDIPHENKYIYNSKALFTTFFAWPTTISNKEESPVALVHMNKQQILRRH